MQNNKSIVQNIQNYAEHTFDESYITFSEIINSEPTTLCVPDYINNPLWTIVNKVDRKNRKN